MRYSFLPCSRALLSAAIGSIAVTAVPTAAQAVTTTTAIFQVTAIVLPVCVATTPATLAFGTYNSTSATALAGNTTFTVTCSIGTPYSLGLSPGAGTGATVTARNMTSPTATPAANAVLSYGLFKDAAFATNWDNNVSGTGYTATGLVVPYTIYGNIPAHQYSAKPATDYADTITLSLSY